MIFKCVSAFLDIYILWCVIGFFWHIRTAQNGSIVAGHIESLTIIRGGFLFSLEKTVVLLSLKLWNFEIFPVGLTYTYAHTQNGKLILINQFYTICTNTSSNHIRLLLLLLLPVVWKQIKEQTERTFEEKCNHSFVLYFLIQSTHIKYIIRRTKKSVCVCKCILMNQ